MFFQLFLSQRFGGSALRARFLLFVQYWQDVGIRTRVAATADRWATNELHAYLLLLDRTFEYFFSLLLTMFSSVS